MDSGTPCPGLHPSLQSLEKSSNTVTDHGCLRVYNKLRYITVLLGFTRVVSNGSKHPRLQVYTHVLPYPRKKSNLSHPSSETLNNISRKDCVNQEASKIQGVLDVCSSHLTELGPSGWPSTTSLICLIPRQNQRSPSTSIKLSSQQEEKAPLGKHSCIWVENKFSFWRFKKSTGMSN